MLIKRNSVAGLVTHICNSRTLEVEAGGFPRVWGWSHIHSEPQTYIVDFFEIPKQNKQQDNKRPTTLTTEYKANPQKILKRKKNIKNQKKSI